MVLKKGSEFQSHVLGLRVFFKMRLWGMKGYCFNSVGSVVRQIDFDKYCFKF